MKKIVFVLSIATVVFGFVNRTTPQNNELDHWVGSWVADYEGGKFYEHWEKKSSELYEAKGYLVIQGDTVFRELLRVEKIGSHWAYIASINGGKPTMFPLKSAEDGKWTFENKEHDFPQRIIYHLQKDGKLYAKVEGKMKGKEVVEEYLYTRVN